MDEWFSEWFEIYKKPYVKDSSIPVIIRKYKNSFGRLLGGRQIKNIINVDIQFAINKLKEEEKGALTIKDALGFLTQCLEIAKQNELILKNPCFEIKVDWKPKRMPREAISVDMQTRFLEIVENSRYREFEYTLFFHWITNG